MSYSVKAISAIRPRVKPTEPATSQHVDCPYPGQWGPGLDQTRTGTFNYVTFQWDMSGWTTVGGQCQVVPASPPTTQHLDCPEGYTGTGIDQNRTCTFNYTSGAWECTDWVTTTENCTIAQVQFVTANIEMSPNIGGGPTSLDDVQDYNPPPVAANGYTMTLAFHAYTIEDPPDQDPPSYVARCNLTITVVPDSGTPSAAGRNINVFWDRPYATFPDQTLDGSGATGWSAVPLDQFTQNETSFTITMT